MKKQFLIALALFIAALNSRPAINSIAPLLDNIRTDLGMSGSVASLLTSIPVLCMGLFSPIAVKAGRKWGIEKVIGVALMIIAVGTAIRVFSNSVFYLLVTALIAGIGIALIGPLLTGFIKKNFPKQVPSMISLYTVALTLGAALSSGLSALLQRSFDSWQYSLAFWAIIAVVAAILWWQIVRPNDASPNPTAAGATGAKLPWGNGKAWILMLSFGLMGMLFYSYTAWLPQIIQDMGFSKSYSATSLTLFVVIQIPVSLLVPLLLQRFPSRRLWLVACSTLQLIGLLLLMLKVEPAVAALFIGIGAGGSFPLNLLLPIDATTSAQEATSWSAMVQSVGYVIGASGPILFGKIHDATDSFASAVVGMTAIVLLMVIVQFAATAAKRKPMQTVLQTG
ncbi:CynX/NimT family MFS transporter [Cohnella lupini]|uniref:CP family cyanate transporter-like MFS transporter n=1 Tax=Cohnella lupini TaxID=1294267 RepID=A0A3D9IX85_9BACL|nr:MFS transporter [Cohnella lupini]RED66325.1 CP family cyanate transporter-like MFS transporter [Cohnella lupini]